MFIYAGPAGRALPNGHSPVDETQVQTNETVVSFLRTCGEPNLQFLLQPKRLERALKVLDTSNDGEVDVDEWEEAINRGLAKRLQQMSEERARAARAAAAEDEEFSAEFLSMARQVFQMIDKDNSGTLVKQEIVEAVSEQSNPVVLFLINCGNENLQYLLVPARLDAAMAAIDTDSDGEITAIEWRVSESEILGRLRRGGGVLVA